MALVLITIRPDLRSLPLSWDRKGTVKVKHITTISGAQHYSASGTHLNHTTVLPIRSRSSL